MRSVSEMMELILQTASEDDRIRVVIMNGSRANPDAPQDPFQDFDIVYGVTELAPYVQNLPWIDRFGERMILQMPEAMQDPPPSNDGCFAYLMQFIDGNRIDLGICPLELLDKENADSQSILLLDKDGIYPPLPPPSDRDYLPAPPTAGLFGDCCNEFWWVSSNVAKGLWRNELPYARCMLDPVMREPFMKMIAWQIGIQTNFSKSPGKFGKYFQRYLDAETWEMLLKTYAGGSIEHTWDALLAMCDLFHRSALLVAQHFGFDYPLAEALKVRAHLLHVRALPADAQEIY
jgi:aminoglycoside 6-adenylyltransferase